MFTGLIEEMGQVKTATPFRGGLRLGIFASGMSPALVIGDSVAINGACQTVVAADANAFQVECLETTLAKTGLGELRPGKGVNLERALKADSRLDGHLVQGHINGRGRIADIRRQGGSRFLAIHLDEDSALFCVPEGSICVDGVSLTIAAMNDKVISINVIPHTWDNTAFREARKGDLVNLETDILGRYVRKFIQNMGLTGSAAAPVKPGLMDLLRRG
jgi:riboflavin synthase